MFDLEKASVSYLNAVRASGCSEDTLSNYSRQIAQYISFAKAEQKIGNSPADISDYKVSLCDRGLKQSTIRAYLETLALFFAWCVDAGVIEETPCKSMIVKTKVPPPKKYPHLLSREDFSALLSPVCPKGATRTVWPRTYAMTVVFLTSSMRNSELRALTPEDLDFEHGLIHVRSGKGDKERWCSFPPTAQSAVRAYLLSPIRPNKCAQSDFLFGKVNSHGEWKPFERTELSAIIERYVRLVTGKSDFRTHALRHSSAGVLQDCGLSTDEISELLGHSNVGVTARYLDRLRPERPAEAASDIFSALSAAV